MFIYLYCFGVEGSFLAAFRPLLRVNSSSCVFTRLPLMFGTNMAIKLFTVNVMFVRYKVRYKIAGKMQFRLLMVVATEHI